MEGFLTRHVSEVVEDLVPEACVEEVQNGVFDTADIEVDATGVTGSARAHPVALDVGIDECSIVGRVEVAQFVPARTCPLWHHVDFAAVLLRSVTEVECDGHPIAHACEWRDGTGDVIVGVECLRLEVGEFGKQHGERGLGNCSRLIVVVVDDGERLAPVALA